MAVVNLPQLGETVIEGTISRHLVKVGEHVALDSPLFEVSTDKVDTEVPSPIAGVLVRWLIAEGVTCPVGTAVCEVADDTNSPTTTVAAAEPTPPTAPQPTPAPTASPTPAPASSPAAPAPQPAPVSAPTPVAAPVPAPVAAPAPVLAAAVPPSANPSPASHGGYSFRFEIAAPVVGPHPESFVAFCALRAAERTGMMAASIAVSVQNGPSEAFVSIPRAADWRLDRLTREISAAATALTPERLLATTLTVSYGPIERSVFSSSVHIHVTEPRPGVVGTSAMAQFAAISVVTVSCAKPVPNAEAFCNALQSALGLYSEHL